MKLIYFSLDYTPHDHRFLTAIAESGHQVFYVRLQRGARQVESRPVPPEVEIVLWAGGQKPFAWRDLPEYVLDFRRIVRRIQPDLIHAGPIQTCAFIALLSGFRPILTMSWGFDLMQDVHRGKGWEWVTRYVLKNTQYFTSDAEVTRQKAIAYGMNPARTVVFPWGVDLTHFTPKDWETSDAPAAEMTHSQNSDSAGTTHAPAELSDDWMTLFCNRAWEPIYGVDVLARAFVRVAAEIPNLRLLLVGSGSQGNRIREILMQGGVLERVIFPGQVRNTDLPRFYHMADLYISPSHIDGSSVSLMEAMACGLPCLVSDIPANREWVQEGYNGWLFRDGDDADLAAKLRQALQQRQHLPQIGRNARRIAEERADWRKNVQVLLETYQKVKEAR
ncbi:MAG: glycosyltransferase family 4 protein [Anaerolineales bacterium]|nr:glycosyltransferase family 4 protein [Anaerolineales bacterium]MCX7755328.1 glycosyltransferase family 4 protein [Anaerolineales bacterium]MDW8279315.1 glycosyltransferase family 4 protein [Anaerolineales bacterium]